MIKYLNQIILIAVVLGLFVPTVGAAGADSVTSSLGSAGVVSNSPLPIPTPATGDDLPGNYTKLEIMPAYLNPVSEPGVTKEMTVTVRNRDTKPVHITPVVRHQPYGGPNVAENSWTAVAPAVADIAPGESAKFNIAVTVPEGTLRGMYSSLVTFTDQAYPSPYPQPFPNYLHSLSLNINLASSPVIQVSSPYINDQLEAGKDYTYTVDIRNKGNAPLSLNPRLGDEGYPMHGPYGPQEPALTTKSFTVSSPPRVLPGQNATVTLKLNVPPDASGYFNGYLDLGIDDPSVLMEENRVQLSFLVWKQPQGGFSKKFTVTSQEPLSVELTSSQPMMGPKAVAGESRDMSRSEPSFDTTLSGPAGKTNLILVEKAIKGSVSLGTDPFTGNADRTGKYQETQSQYIFTYSAPVTQGEWTLGVTPRNTQYFEYKITMGGGEPASNASLIGEPSLFIPNLLGK